ncbi:MAG: thioredoxin TrxC [Deltaproteobacteria bacterium]|nr:thioredoxin TrxC [Deltaproteobacteria bacterium]
MTPDDLIIPCPHCGTKNRIPWNRRGDQAICGKCRRPFTTGGSRLDHPVEVTDQSFTREVLQHPGPVVLDCWAPWCGPCRSVAPVLDQLAREYAGKVKIAKLNTDQNQQTARNYSIQSIPTLLFFKGGKLVNRQVGALPKPEMERLIRTIL